MRGVRGLMIAAVLLFAIPATAQLQLAEPPAELGGTGVLEVTLTPAEITVGDRVEAELKLVWTGAAPAAPPRFPAWQETWGPAEVLSVSEVESFSDQGPRHVYRQAVTLTAFTTGEVTLPEVSVALPLGAETIEISHDSGAGFEVRSVLPEDPAAAQPRPPAPPLRLAAGSRFAWTAGALAGLGLLMIWRLQRRLEGAGGGAPAPARPEPLAELLLHLRRLDAATAEPAHTGLSLALRRFLGRSLDFPATESTTREIRSRLGATRGSPVAAGNAVRLLSDCDQVKFARLAVSESVTAGRLIEARDLARAIDLSLAPPDPEASR